MQLFLTGDKTAQNLELVDLVGEVLIPRPVVFDGEAFKDASLVDLLGEIATSVRITLPVMLLRATSSRPGSICIWEASKFWEIETRFA